MYYVVQPSLVVKFYVRNRGLNTLWESDDPNRPNSVPDSETMLLDWRTTGDNWSQCHGGKGANRKTGVIKKEQTSKLLVDEIKKASIAIPGNPKAVSAKIAHMKSECKNAYDFVKNTGQGLMDEYKDITETIKNDVFSLLCARSHYGL